MKKILGLILLSCLSSTAIAATWTNGNIEVKNIIWRPTIKGFYVSSSLFHDPQNCGGTDNLYRIDEALDDNAKNQLLSILMNAQATNSKLNVWVDGCIGTRPKMTGLQLNP